MLLMGKNGAYSIIILLLYALQYFLLIFIVQFLKTTTAREILFLVSSARYL